MEDYRTIRGTAIGEYEEKKSRFIAQLAFADSEEKAVAFLEQVRAANRTARHNVYAYRLREGNRERYSDDGEPAKTAGTPALEVLQHSGLTDLIVVVTRYFGGVLLGTGGLVRAYTNRDRPRTGKRRGRHGAQRGGAGSDGGLRTLRAGCAAHPCGRGQTRRPAVHRPRDPALADAGGHRAAAAGTAAGADAGRGRGERLAAVLCAVLMPLSVSHSLVRSPEVGAIGGRSRMQGCRAAALWAQQHREIFIG